MVELPSWRKLEEIRREIIACRRAIYNVRSRELQSIAKRLGRRLEGKRGKEPQWVSDFAKMPGLPPRALLPIGIPSDVKGTGTKRNILTDLEADVETLEAFVDEEKTDPE